MFNSYVVMRTDKKDIHPHQIEALRLFCQQIVQPAMQRQIDQEGNPGLDITDGIIQQRESVMAKELSREHFESFFAEYKKMKIEEGYDSWKAITSPLAEKNRVGQWRLFQIRAFNDTGSCRAGNSD